MVRRIWVESDRIPGPSGGQEKLNVLVIWKPALSGPQNCPWNALAWLSSFHQAFTELAGPGVCLTRDMREGHELESEPFSFRSTLERAEQFEGDEHAHATEEKTLRAPGLMRQRPGPLTKTPREF